MLELAERVEHEEAFVQLEESDDQDAAEKDDLCESEEADKNYNIDCFVLWKNL